MAVKELPPLVWRTFAEGRTQLSDDGAVATQMDLGWSLTTTRATGFELTEGKHYWEVELGSTKSTAFIGISRPNLDPTGLYAKSDCTDGWFVCAQDGSLCGNGRQAVQSTTERTGGSTKGNAPPCPPKAAEFAPLHAPLSTRLDEISSR
jgi:hypothetical protein